MRSATYDLTSSSARADALFASPLQRSDEPGPTTGLHVPRRGFAAACVCHSGGAGGDGAGEGVAEGDRRYPRWAD